jgi:hypothetical protein
MLVSLPLLLGGFASQIASIDFCRTENAKDERVPSKEELRKIFLAADIQQRVACSLLAHSGLRPETLGDYKGGRWSEVF